MKARINSSLSSAAVLVRTRFVVETDVLGDDNAAGDCH